MCISVCERKGYETRLECHLLLRYLGVITMEQVLAARLWCECVCIRIDEYMNINVILHIINVILHLVYTYVCMYELKYVYTHTHARTNRHKQTSVNAQIYTYIYAYT